MKPFGLAIACAAIMGLATIGYVKYRTYAFERSPEGESISSERVAAQTANDDLQMRVNFLAKDGCNAATTAALSQKTAQPQTGFADLPAAVQADLSLCLERGIFRAYNRGRLKDAGILAMIQAS